MNSERRRDAIDQLLRQGLRKPAAAVPADACLEADMLAAWIDGTLTREELVRAEAHAAGCSRCQAILSSMVRTAPAAPRHRWWAQTATLRWLVPITAVAAIALWVAVPPRPSVNPAEEFARSRADRAGAPSAPSMAPPPAAATGEKSETLTIARAAGPERKNAASLAAEPADRKLQENELRRGKAKDARATDSLSALLPSADQSAPRFQAPPARPEAQPVAPPPPPPPPAMPPPAAAKAAAPAAANEPVAQAVRASGFAAGRGGAGAPVDIMSPDPAVRWRLAGTGTVQRSTDGGVTWTTQQTGTTVPLSAGSAPSIQVCWLVGRAGTILLSTNGATWQLRPFPEGVDLIAVRATDAKTATVTTADGRQFATTDGGATWTRPQEPPAAPFYQ